MFFMSCPRYRKYLCCTVLKIQDRTAGQDKTGIADPWSSLRFILNHARKSLFNKWTKVSFDSQQTDSHTKYSQYRRNFFSEKFGDMSTEIFFSFINKKRVGIRCHNSNYFQFIKSLTSSLNAAKYHNMYNYVLHRTKLNKLSKKYICEILSWNMTSLMTYLK
jgi:hypothetical protein